METDVLKEIEAWSVFREVTVEDSHYHHLTDGRMDCEQSGPIE